MEETAKYLVHADITTDGVVERSDVVGAVFGQTEGLLGGEMEIHILQQSAKLGRIDVEIESEGGRSFGTLTIASNLDRVETAVLAAALETIERVGPCRSSIHVTDIEDARTTKRRMVVERATELLASAFDDEGLTGDELVETVRERIRVAEMAEFDGFPAGPHVSDGDAIILVEGRADVRTLLRYGIKNAVAVEGTDVPKSIAGLTHERTATAFLDGDRGGDLILRELAQVANVDFVARAPTGRSVEDMTHGEVRAALRNKVDIEVALAALETGDDDEDGRAASSADTKTADTASTDGAGAQAAAATYAEEMTETADDGDATDVADADGTTEGAVEVTAVESDGRIEEPTETLIDHVVALIGEETGRVRLLDDEWHVLAEGAVADVFDAITSADPTPYAVVIDGTVTQRLLDVAAQRGVSHVVCRERGEFTKQPVSVRVRTAAELLAPRR